MQTKKAINPSVFSLKTYIFKLKIYISSLEIQISRLEIKFAEGLKMHANSPNECFFIDMPATQDAACFQPVVQILDFSQTFRHTCASSLYLQPFYRVSSFLVGICI